MSLTGQFELHDRFLHLSSPAAGSTKVLGAPPSNCLPHLKYIVVFCRLAFETAIATHSSALRVGPTVSCIITTSNPGHPNQSEVIESSIQTSQPPGHRWMDQTRINPERKTVRDDS
ncbi:hypothetical protein HCH54_005240 [Aspergillus fumigatus]